MMHTPKQILKTYSGYDSFRPLQEEIINNPIKQGEILDQDGKPMFITDGKLKYLRNKLYRLNLKRECFTLKGMSFNGSVWIKGTKKIVAYPQSELYRMIIDTTDYSDEVEDIVDSPAGVTFLFFSCLNSREA